MTYAELSEAQARRSRQFAEAQTNTMSVYCDAERDLKELQTENARLRELALALYYCTTSGKCDECPVNGGGAVHLMPDTICDTMHASMRELGVEVDK